jgi:type I restriction enzyme S subunit
MQDLLTKGIDENGNIRSEKTHKFKDSPLGRIPEEWEVKKIKEFVLKIIDNRGRTPPTSEEGIDLIETVCITDKNKKHPDFSKVRNYVSEDTYNKWFRSGHPKEKDILIAMVGENVGSVAIMNNLKGCIAQNLIALRLEGDTYPEFLYYLLISEYFQRQMFVVLMTAAQPSLKLPHLLNFIFPLPPLFEQQRIAEILSQIDQTIEKEEQYKEKLERLKQGLMQDLLTGKVRVNHLIKEGAENVST